MQVIRFAIAAIVAAGLATAPAVAQDVNEVNTAAPADTVATTPENAVGEPVLPVTNAPVAVTEPVAPAETADVPVTGRREASFPWGLIGLVGLIGLLGRRRS